jgi:hypothetical protein
MAMVEAREEHPQFFDSHQEALKGLFVALGREHEWHPTPKGILDYTQKRWVGVEHGNSAEKDQFTDEQIAAAQPYLRDLGLVEAAMPSAGFYEEVVIIGGMTRVNRERMGFVKDLIDDGTIKTERIVFWAGQRLRDKRDDPHLAAVDRKKVGADPWAATQYELPVTYDWTGQFATETDSARLAYLEQYPKAKLIEMIPADNSQVVPGVPARLASQYVFEAPDAPEFRLMNAAAVARAKGTARHTTASCAMEYLADVASTGLESVLFVSGNPHIGRNGRELRDIFKIYRPDLMIDICGPAANPQASIQLMLGEPGREIHMDVQAKSLTVS